MIIYYQINGNSVFKQGFRMF